MALVPQLTWSVPRPCHQARTVPQNEGVLHSNHQPVPVVSRHPCSEETWQWQNARGPDLCMWTPSADSAAQHPRPHTIASGTAVPPYTDWNICENLYTTLVQWPARKNDFKIKSKLTLRSGHNSVVITICEGALPSFCASVTWRVAKIQHTTRQSVMGDKLVEATKLRNFFEALDDGLWSSALQVFHRLRLRFAHIKCPRNWTGGLPVLHGWVNHGQYILMFKLLVESLKKAGKKTAGTTTSSTHLSWNWASAEPNPATCRTSAWRSRFRQFGNFLVVAAMVKPRAAKMAALTEGKDLIVPYTVLTEAYFTKHLTRQWGTPLFDQTIVFIMTAKLWIPTWSKL